MRESIDTIYIEVEVTAVHSDEDVWMQGDLVVRINGERPYTSDEIVDTDALIQSSNGEGEYFIFSCCCGISECAGWHKGICVKHSEEYIAWINLNNGAKWLFDKGQIIKSIKEAKQEAKYLRNYFLSKSIKYVGFGCA